jgi:hypothetical protein
LRWVGTTVALSGRQAIQLELRQWNEIQNVPNPVSILDALLLDPYRIFVWVAYRTDGVAGSGTQNDPYDGSTATKLDTILNNLAANTRIHFGPGTFQINGYQDGATSGWLKSGMRIVGSGINVTTLQMVGAATTNKHYFAIGHPFSSGGQPNLMDYFEISGLTIDCNLAGATTQTACGAVRVMGNHARVRQIKVIKWGNKASAPACFVIAVITADPASAVTGVTDCGIEECIASHLTLEMWDQPPCFMPARKMIRARTPKAMVPGRSSGIVSSIAAGRRPPQKREGCRWPGASRVSWKAIKFTTRNTAGLTSASQAVAK